MKKAALSFIMLMVLLVGVTAVTYAEVQVVEQEKEYKHHIEIFPIVAVAKVYSVQYEYALTAKDSLILGLAYVNPKVLDQQGVEVGQYFSPSLPIGYRRYLWKNLFLEYQVWPAYDFYYDKVTDKFYNGFDLYSELRTGYRFDVDFGELPMFFSLQYVYGIALYPGNKPESFYKAVEDAPPFHMPAISIGIRF